MSRVNCDQMLVSHAVASLGKQELRADVEMADVTTEFHAFCRWRDREPFFLPSTTIAAISV